MIFAVVEARPGVLNFMTVKSVDADRFYGQDLSGDSVSAPVERSVHVGITGGDPNFVIQWTPRWLEAQMSAAAGKTLPLAANPKWTAAPPKSWSKTTGDDRNDRQKDYEDSGLTWPEFQKDEEEAKHMPPGLNYAKGNVKWTRRSRAARREEQAHFLKAATSMQGGRWRAYDEERLYGHKIAKEFISRNRRLMYSNPENLLWCMIFAMLTANEGTASAEANLASFAPIMKEKFAKGEEPTKEDFLNAWGSGLAEQKWKSFSTIYAGRHGLFQSIREAERRGLKDDALRYYIMEKSGSPEGLGIIKFTFALECFGQDVACLDRWMFRAIGANQKVRVHYPVIGTIDPGGYLPKFPRNVEDEEPEENPTKATWPKSEGVLVWGHLGKINAQIDYHKSGKHVPMPPWPPFSDGAYLLGQWATKTLTCRGSGARKVNDPCYAQYRWWEDRLKITEHYKQAARDGFENPLSYAQWRTWEDIMRNHPRPNIRVNFATHSPLWIALTSKAEYGRVAFAETHKHFEKERKAGRISLAQENPDYQPGDKSLTSPRRAKRFVDQIREAGLLAQVEKKYGLDFSKIKLIECGASACVWDYGDKVWKVTTDAQDAQTAQAVLQGRLDLVGPLVRVHDVCRLALGTGSPAGTKRAFDSVWVIVSDLVAPLTSGERSVMESLSLERAQNVMQDWKLFSSPAANQVYGSDFSDMSKWGATQDEVDRAIEAWRGLARLWQEKSISLSYDAHAGNWGRDKKGVIRLFDFGFSSVPGAKVVAQCKLDNPLRRNAYPVREEQIFSNPAAGPSPLGMTKGAALVPIWAAERKTFAKATHPLDVWNLLKDSAHSPVERMYLVLLDRKNSVTGVVLVSQGSQHEAIVTVRESFAPAIEARASAVIFAHNHPSGDPAPSEADIALTKRLIMAGSLVGIPVLDSIILGKDSFRSLREDGIIKDWAPEYKANPASARDRKRLFQKGGIGHVFQEALAIKEGRQNGGTQAAQRLASRLTAPALREFAKH